MLASVKKLYRNTLFRLSLLGAILFVASLLIILGYVYYVIIHSELARVDAALEEEVQEFQLLIDTPVEELLQRGVAEQEDVEELLQLIDSPESLGVAIVSKEISERSSSAEGVYLLQFSPTSFVGNLVFKTVVRQDDEVNELIELNGSTFSKIRLTYSSTETSDDDFQNRRVRALAGNLFQDGKPVAGLIVGRDVEVTMRTADRVLNAVITSSILALILGLITSWFVSRRFTRRVEDFNRLATDVRAGHLDRRAPRNFSEDEMDLLAEHLNAMLDHIDRLMSAMRYAGDSIAHDLRSPLTRLRTRLEHAAVELGENPAADTLFAAAEDASELLKTFDSVLRIARLEAGERRELLHDIDPKSILDDMAELYEPACEDAGLDFSADIAPGLRIMADRGLVSQAVSNLVENAIKYTPKGGAIVLSLSRNKMGRVVINVQDNGPGIPLEERQRVKERFVRLDKSRTEPGSGLGLALVDAIADLHRAEFIFEDGTKSEFGIGLSAKLIFPRRRAMDRRREKTLT